MSSVGCSRVESREVRLTRASLLRCGLSSILPSAESGNSIHTGIFRRLPMWSMTETAPSPCFGRRTT